MPKSKIYLRVVALLAALAALFGSSLACCGSSQGCTGNPFQAPTATPAAAAAGTYTPTVVQTAAQTPPTSAYLDWPVVLFDSFDKDEQHFWTGEVDDDMMTAAVSITGGKYVIKAAAKQPMSWILQAEMPALDDFYLSAEVMKKSGPELAGYGLTFRNRNGADYYFSIIADTQEYLLVVAEGDSWEKIIDWTESTLINPDRPNRLAVLAQGSHFTLLINGEAAAAFEDDALTKGVAGFEFTIREAGESLELEFDNFEVRAP
jgi:hypothetical protein